MSTSPEELHRLVRQLRAELEWAARTGVVVAPSKAPRPPRAPRAAPAKVEPPKAEVRARPEVRPPDDALREPVRAADPAEPTPPPRSRFRDVPVNPARPWERYTTPVAEPAPGSARAAAAPDAPAEASESPAPRAPSSAPRAPAGRPSLAVVAPEPDHRALAAALDACRTLDEIRALLGECTRCPLARLGRQTIVFGSGSPTAEVMFVGEGPGLDEDRSGEPFVGKAGQLLTRIIEDGMKMPRAEVYIANVVKCRPPGNRDPEPGEIASCSPFLRAQIRVVAPRVIIGLGKHATDTLLGSEGPITRRRGRWVEAFGVPLMPTLHPSFLLRNPEAKREVWSDIKEVLRFLGHSVPGSAE